MKKFQKGILVVGTTAYHRHSVTYPYLQCLLEMEESLKEDTVVTVEQISEKTKKTWLYCTCTQKDDTVET